MWRRSRLLPLPASPVIAKMLPGAIAKSRPALDRSRRARTWRAPAPRSGRGGGRPRAHSLTHLKTSVITTSASTTPTTGGHHRPAHRHADGAGAAAAAQPVVARRDRGDGPEREALDQPREGVLVAHHAARALDELLGRQVGDGHRGEQGAGEPERVRVDDEQHARERRREHTGAHEVVESVDADEAQDVHLVVRHHRRDLGGDRGPEPPGDRDAHHQRAHLAQHRDRHDARDERAAPTFWSWPEMMMVRTAPIANPIRATIGSVSTAPCWK